MKNCKQCGNSLVHVEGRKQKSFCSVNCRNKYFYRQQKKLADIGKKSIVSDLNKQSSGTTQDLNKKEETNFTINTSEIDELKKELNSLGTGSLANQRKKYLQNKILALEHLK